MPRVPRRTARAAAAAAAVAAGCGSSSRLCFSLPLLLVATWDGLLIGPDSGIRDFKKELSVRASIPRKGVVYIFLFLHSMLSSSLSNETKSFYGVNTN